MDRGEVVPFLGAGISHDASLDPRLQAVEGCQGPLHHTGLMVQRLLEYLDLLESQQGGVLEGMYDPHEARKTESLAQLSETVAAVAGHEVLCTILGIQHFADLRPTTAHRCLARLMMEGVVPEVITTNYDCCLENAWTESMGRSEGEDPAAAGPHGLDVVTSGRDYLFGSTRSLQAPGQQGPCRSSKTTRQCSIPNDATPPADAGALPGPNPRERCQATDLPRVYKINGCAGLYKKSLEDRPGRARESPDSEESRRIVLTERQLQTWRRERWAEEMFRDRVRCRHILFSGFGSEEPQIRHTALALAEELERYTTDDQGLRGGHGVGGSEVADRRSPEHWRCRNAPKVHIYGETPSFFQAQILWSHFQAHEQKATLLDLAHDDKGSDSRSWLQNAFTGHDAPWFTHGRKNGALPADHFWLALLHGWWEFRFKETWCCRRQGIFLSLVARRNRGIRAYSWFQRAILEASRRLFRAKDRDYAPRCPILGPDGACDENLEDRVSRAVSTVTATPVIERSSPAYTPFKEHRLLTALLLMAVAWSSGTEGVQAPDSLQVRDGSIRARVARPSGEGKGEPNNRAAASFRCSHVAFVTHRLESGRGRGGPWNDPPGRVLKVRLPIDAWAVEPSRGPAGSSPNGNRNRGRLTSRFVDLVKEERSRSEESRPEGTPNRKAPIYEADVSLVDLIDDVFDLRLSEYDSEGAHPEGTEFFDFLDKAAERAFLRSRPEFAFPYRDHLKPISSSPQKEGVS